MGTAVIFENFAIRGVSIQSFISQTISQ